MGLMGLEVEKKVLEAQAPKALEKFHGLLADMLETPHSWGPGAQTTSSSPILGSSS